MRRRKDPRAAKVIAALDATLAYDATGRSVDTFIVQILIDAIDFGHWSPDALRSVLVTLARHAPSDDLDALAEAADDQISTLAECAAERAEHGEAVH